MVGAVVAAAGMSLGPPFEAMILCGLSGLTLVELLKLLVLRECWTPCTMLVFLWCPYDTEGFLSTSKLCFGRA